MGPGSPRAPKVVRFAPVPKEKKCGVCKHCLNPQRHKPCIEIRRAQLAAQALLPPGAAARWRAEQEARQAAAGQQQPSPQQQQPREQQQQGQQGAGPGGQRGGSSQPAIPGSQPLTPAGEEGPHRKEAKFRPIKPQERCGE